MEKLKSFYKNKRVFITGHTGFKGSWLVNTLIHFGSKVYGYSLDDQNKKNYSNFCNYKKVQNNYGDILDIKKLKNCLNRINPEIIFHLAAQPIVSESYKNPKLTIETNLNGTLNLIESVRKLKKIKSVVIITSDKCYQNKEILRGYKEIDRLGGDDPYSASKAAAEIVYNSYLKSKLVNLERYGVATARAGNVIGGGDWSRNRIIPDCMRSIIGKKKFFIRSPNSTRPWQHVLEPVSGYLLLAKKLYENPKRFSSPWNFGPSAGQTLSVKKVVSLFFQELNIKKSYIKSKGSFKESKLLKLNSQKSYKFLGWKNSWSMKKSIKETAIWYKHFLKKKDIKDFTEKQINRYFDD